MGLMRALNKDDHNSGCVMGKISVGEKVTCVTKEGKTYERPVSLDYFKPSGNYTQAFTQAYGEKPSLIEVMFTPNEEDVNEYFVCLDKSGKLMRKTNNITDFALSLDWYGDPDFTEFAQSGLQFTAFQSAKTGGLFVFQAGKVFGYKEEYWAEVGQMQPEQLKQLQHVTWKRYLELRLFLPKIKDIYGLWVYQTSGITSIEPLRNSIMACKEIFGVNFSRTPFDMQVKMQEGAGGKRYPVVSIVPNFSKIETLLQTSMIRLAAPKPQALLLGDGTVDYEIE